MKCTRFVFIFLLLWMQYLGYGQDFSNKGKDFWVGYGYHINMAGNASNGGSQDMVLYFTSDKNASVTVEIPGVVGYKQTYAVIANQVTTSNPIPKTGTQDARISTPGLFDRGIHITSDVSIVAYAHIYNANVSGASLLFPTNTLGRDYYSVNFTQSSNAANSNSFFFVVATEDNTSVEITPSAANLNGKAAGTPFTVSLNAGQIYNVMGTTTGNQGTDLTGSRIRSISSNGSGGCKKIAVFSGAGKISIGGAGNAGGSADNIFAQAFPSVAWGKKYLTVPTGSQPNNFYRVCVTDPTTVVKLNGNILPSSSLVNGFYYQFKNANAAGTNPPVPNLIESDKPIMVAQYCTTQGQEGNPNTTPFGDPEMIYLSPVEQTINNITLYSASKFLILQSYINIVLKKGGVTSFTLDGISKSASFQAHPQDTNYSYAILPVNAGSHSLYSDTGFNAIAYGFGSAESYGYNAGTNIRDFTPVASFQNQFARIDSAVTCANSPLQFSVPLSFQPTTIKWDFSAAPNIIPNASIGPVTGQQPDSTASRNGLTLNYYSPKTSFSFSRANTAALRDTIKLYTTSGTPDGCGSTDQVFTIPVAVNEAPVANFVTSNGGCLSDPVQLTDQSSGSNSTLIRWLWNFSDGTTADLNTASITPKLYNSAGTGSYDIKLKVVSAIGCVSAEKIQTIKISNKPVAKYTLPPTACVNETVSFTDASTLQTPGTIAKWIWDLGNGAGPIISTTNAPQSTKYATYGPKDVKLVVESFSGCQSDTFRISPQFTVTATPEPGFIVPEVCLNDANALFTDTTKSADGATNFTYLWDMNAGSPAITPGPNTKTSTAQNPSVHYNDKGYYKVSLTVTSKGCVASLVKDFTVNGANPIAAFEVQKPTGLCSNDSVRIKNKSSVGFGSLTRLEIFWDANDLTKKTVDEDPFPDKIYGYRYPDFQTPSSKNYSIRLVAYSGNSASCSSPVSQTVTVNASPKVSFVTMPGICNEASSRQITQAKFDPQVPGSFTYIGNGVSSTGLFNAQTAGVGTFAIKYLYTSTKNCMDSATRNIIVWPSPLAKWTISNPVCQKNDLVFTDSSVANYSNIIQRNWNYDDGTAVVTRTNNNSYSRQFALAKTYNISLQVVTDSGCRSTVNVQPIKVNYLPKLAFTLPGICLPDGKGQFTNQSTIDDGSESLFSYLWQFNDPNDPSSSTLKEPIHKYSALGPYNVSLQITTKDGCKDSLTKSLTTIYPQPKASFTATPSEVCVGDSIFFKDTGNGMSSAATTWAWDLANGTISTLQNPTKKFTDSGTFNVSYYFFNGQGCVSDTTSKMITVYPYPKLVMGPNLKLLQGGVITIKPKFVYGTELQYQWYPSLYLNSDTAATPKSTPADDITYKLILTGKGGCSVSDTIFIEVLKAPVVPNVFSPNGDGINDTWRIKYLESYPGAEIDVYNRYGQVVFHSTGYDVDWDGTYNGKPMPIGTYYYIINPKNGREIIKGAVTIIK